MKQPIASWLYLAGLATATLVRIAYARRVPVELISLREPEPLGVKIAMAVWGVSQLAAVAFVTTTWIDAWNYTVPPFGTSIGLILLGIAIILLWRSHVDLGQQWSATLQIHREHELVTSGIYRSIRHPMYTAHIIWSIAQGLLIPNWLAGPAALLAISMLCYLRIPREEHLLLRQFGPAYESYRLHTGGLWPRRFITKNSS